jgi:hypothetical protein
LPIIRRYVIGPYSMFEGLNVKTCVYVTSVTTLLCHQCLVSVRMFTLKHGALGHCNYILHAIKMQGIYFDLWLYLLPVTKSSPMFSLTSVIVGADPCSYIQILILQTWNRNFLILFTRALWVYMATHKDAEKNILTPILLYRLMKCNK